MKKQSSQQTLQLLFEVEKYNLQIRKDLKQGKDPRKVHSRDRMTSTKKKNAHKQRSIFKYYKIFQNTYSLTVVLTLD